MVTKQTAEKIISKARILKAASDGMKRERSAERKEKIKKGISKVGKGIDKVESKISKGLYSKKLRKKPKKILKDSKMIVRIENKPPAPYINQYFNKGNIKGSKTYI